MRKLLGSIAATGLMVVAAPVFAGPISFDFAYSSGSNTYNFGTMTVSVLDATSLAVRFDAGNPSGASGFEITGFGFDFNPEMSSLTVSNPLDSAFNFDQNELDWIKLNNLNALPNPANNGSVSKSAFEFGVTEEDNGGANTITPPGIRANQTDIFYLHGFSGLTASTDVGSMIDWVGIRIQSLPGSINGGSLFLVNTPPRTQVPEPASLLLLSAGLLGLGLARRRRR